MTYLGPRPPALCNSAGCDESHPPRALGLPMVIFLPLKESDPWASLNFHPPGERNLGGTGMGQMWVGPGVVAAEFTCSHPHPPQAPGPLHKPRIGILFHPTTPSTSFPPVAPGPRPSVRPLCCLPEYVLHRAEVSPSHSGGNPCVQLVPNGHKTNGRLCTPAIIVQEASFPAPVTSGPSVQTRGASISRTPMGARDGTGLRRHSRGCC